MYQHVVLLSDLSYQLGLIGIAEYQECMEVAAWLSDAKNELPDPREHLEPDTNKANKSETERIGAGDVFQPIGSEEKEVFLSFLLLKKWVFTLGDVDCYPSVPHGHLHKKTNEWPKLNPYVGRVFSGMHQENTAVRLKKSEMILMWNNEDFVHHCREQIFWYSNFSPRYPFPNARRGKYCFPRWRK